MESLHLPLKKLFKPFKNIKNRSFVCSTTDFVAGKEIVETNSIQSRNDSRNIIVRLCNMVGGGGRSIQKCSFASEKSLPKLWRKKQEFFTSSVLDSTLVRVKE